LEEVTVGDAAGLGRERGEGALARCLLALGRGVRAAARGGVCRTRGLVRWSGSWELLAKWRRGGVTVGHVGAAWLGGSGLRGLGRRPGGREEGVRGTRRDAGVAAPGSGGRAEAATLGATEAQGWRARGTLGRRCDGNPGRAARRGGRLAAGGGRERSRWRGGGRSVGTDG
jgi:hypothetical protein